MECSCRVVIGNNSDAFCHLNIQESKTPAHRIETLKLKKKFQL